MQYHTALSPSEQIALGIDPPQTLAMGDMVRFSELDVLNHVNNARYVEWFERLRIAYVQHIGLSDYRGAPDAPRIVIRSGTIHYRQEMRMDESYVVTCTCTAFRRTSFTLAQQLWSGGTLRATFDCVLVLRTQGGAAGFPIPERIKAHFADIEGAIAGG